VTVLAALGLAQLGGRCLGLLWSRTARADRRQREAGLLGLAALALALLPLVVVLRDRQHPYQFMKLILSVGPLLVVGVAHAWDGLPAPRAVRAWLRGGTLAALLAVALTGTGALALATAFPKAGFRSAQGAVLDGDFRALCHRLASLKGYKVVLACGPGVFQNCWPAYALRRNDVWLVNPLVNDNMAVGCSRSPAPGARLIPMGGHLIDLCTVPGEALLVEVAGGPMLRVEGERRLLWANETYQLWKLGPGPFALRPTEAAWRPR
jgi:hypothetical protein